MRMYANIHINFESSCFMYNDDDDDEDLIEYGFAINEYRLADWVITEEYFKYNIMRFSSKWIRADFCGNFGPRLGYFANMFSIHRALLLWHIDYSSII